jgi:hypothetical protein
MGSSGVDTNPVEYADQEYADPTGLLSANDTVDVFPTTAAAEADVQAAASPRAPRCVLSVESSGIAQGFASGTTAAVGVVRVDSVTVPAAGNQATGMRIDIPFTTNGTSSTSYETFIEVRKGRSVSVLVLSGTGSPPSAQLIAQMSTEVSRSMSVS